MKKRDIYQNNLSKSTLDISREELDIKITRQISIKGKKNKRSSPLNGISNKLTPQIHTNI